MKKLPSIAKCVRCLGTRPRRTLKLTSSGPVCRDNASCTKRFNKLPKYQQKGGTR